MILSYNIQASLSLPSFPRIIRGKPQWAKDLCWWPQCKDSRCAIDSPFCNLHCDIHLWIRVVIENAFLIPPLARIVLDYSGYYVQAPLYRPRTDHPRRCMGMSSRTRADLVASRIMWDIKHNYDLQEKDGIIRLVL